MSPIRPLTLTVACAHSAAGPRGTAIKKADPIPQAEVPEATRRFLRMSQSDPERRKLRDGLVASVIAQAQSLTDVGGRVVEAVLA